MPQCCRQPFTAIEIGYNGDVFTCCPSFINNYKIGNIFEATAKDIWYSDLAVNLRQKILHGDYTICNRNICRQFQPRDIEEKNFTLTPSFPRYITLAYDKECNLNCITCRDNKYKNSEELVQKYNQRIEEVLLPLLQNAEILALSGSGEALYSSHSRLLIKNLSKVNDKLSYNLNTNGILLNENNCRELGILGRINEIFVSLPALDEDLYKKIMRGSDLNTVLKNIEWMAKEQGKSIKKVTINSVISKLNYSQIPSLVEFAKKLNIYITLSPFNDWGTQFAKEYDYDVWNSDNNENNKFTVILKNLEHYERLTTPPLFANLLNKE